MAHLCFFVDQPEALRSSLEGPPRLGWRLPGQSLHKMYLLGRLEILVLVPAVR